MQLFESTIMSLFAAQRAVSLFSLSEPQGGGQDMRPVISPVQFHTPQTPRTTPTFSGCLFPLPPLPPCGNSEKQDKVVLLAEMANLRENNQRLQVESQTASEQLRKFSMFFSNINKPGGSDQQLQKKKSVRFRPRRRASVRKMFFQEAEVTLSSRKFFWLPGNCSQCETKVYDFR
ncbi:hypothetical protein INR49_022094 [Caranx melampygus]|nr:hypothetical protein INR49_022094 [Caranx melampygus]